MQRVPLTVTLTVSLTVLALGAGTAMAKDKHGHSHGHTHKAHSHGDARLDVAVDAKALAIEFEAPGDVVFGFEHKARTEAQKNTVTTEIARLSDKYAELFTLPAAAKCTLTEKTISAPQAAGGEEKEDTKGKKKDHEAHADVKAAYQFACEGDLTGAKLKLGLFAAWPRLKNLKVQVLGSAGQKGMTLKNDKTELDL